MSTTDFHRESLSHDPIHRYITFTSRRGCARGEVSEQEIIDHPCDLGLLFQANTMNVANAEKLAEFVGKIVAFHHGRPYWDETPARGDEEGQSLQEGEGFAHIEDV